MRVRALALAPVLFWGGVVGAQDFKGILHEYNTEIGDSNIYLGDIKRAGARRAGIGILWREWEPNPLEAPFGGPVVPPCAPELVEFEGRCFRIPTHTDEAIRRYVTDHPAEPGHLLAAAVIYGAPDWANQARRARARAAASPPLMPCALQASPGEVTNELWIYCAPDEDRMADFARFAGMIAKRYDGTGGHGRLDDFLIGNEVNHRARFGFDVGSPPSGPYEGALPSYWTDSYNCLFGKAFDQIRRFRPKAPVRIAVDHYFGGGDFVNKPEKHSGFAMIGQLASYGGERACFQEAPLSGPPRDFQVAVHSYSVDVGGVDFDPQADWRLDSPDWKFITSATLGRLTGWLRQKHPSHADVLVWESGFSSFSAGETAQADALCLSYRQALASPGVSAYLAFRYRDPVPLCEAADDCLGLRRYDDSAKPAWDVWSEMDRLWPFACGFENRLSSLDAAVVLSRYYIGSRHWATTRRPVKDPPPPEMEWLLLRANLGLENGTQEIFECARGSNESDHFLWLQPDCDGQSPLGSVGFAYKSPGQGRVELVQCESPGGDDHLVNPRISGCPAGWREWPAAAGSLGWALRSVADAVVQEGSRDALLAVSVFNPSLETVTVPFATTDGTAIAGLDYLARSGTLTFPYGTTVQTISVPILSDSLAEGNEYMFVDLGDAPPGAIVGRRGQITIADDDVPSAGISVSAIDTTVFEGAATHAAFRVTLSGPSTLPVSVAFATADGTATAGSDYVETTGVLTFAPGRTLHSIAVPVLNQGLSEPSELFQLNLVSATNAAIAGGQAIGTILDVPPAADVPMYRAYNPNAYYHFFTTSLAEFTNAVANGYRDENVPTPPFRVPNLLERGRAAIHRMYNPNSGRHYYTSNPGERDILVGIGWVYEKDEGFVYLSPQPASAEVFKLYNGISGVHLYTVKAAERDAILSQFPGIWFQHTSLGHAFATP